MIEITSTGNRVTSSHFLLYFSYFFRFSLPMVKNSKAYFLMIYFFCFKNQASPENAFNDISPPFPQVSQKRIIQTAENDFLKGLSIRFP